MQQQAALPLSTQVSHIAEPVQVPAASLPIQLPVYIQRTADDGPKCLCS